jgi:uncharacterized membrane protein YqhA
MQHILKYSILVVVFITFINALFYFGLGIFYSVTAYVDIFSGQMDHLPGIVLLESLDRFLIGFVFIIFSVGLSRLFLADTAFLKNYDLPWLNLTSFSQLKTILVSAILVALLVAWIPDAIKLLQGGIRDWTALLFPACILILAVASKFIKELH